MMSRCKILSLISESVRKPDSFHFVNSKFYPDENRHPHSFSSQHFYSNFLVVGISSCPCFPYPNVAFPWIINQAHENPEWDPPIIVISLTLFSLMYFFSFMYPCYFITLSAKKKLSSSGLIPRVEIDFGTLGFPPEANTTFLALMVKYLIAFPFSSNLAH